MRLTNGSKLTPTETKMLKLFSDGLPHSKVELYALLWDDESAMGAIAIHVCRLRKKLIAGHTILCEFRKYQYWYRLVRLIGRAAEIS